MNKPRIPFNNVEGDDKKNDKQNQDLRKKQT